MRSCCQNDGAMGSAAVALREYEAGLWPRRCFETADKVRRGPPAFGDTRRGPPVGRTNGLTGVSIAATTTKGDTQDKRLLKSRHVMLEYRVNRTVTSDNLADSADLKQV